MTLFDRLHWRDPLTRQALEPVIAARTPSGLPLSGALRIVGTNQGYPIVDCVARLTPELARAHAPWLATLGLTPPETGKDDDVQATATVDSFGFQWAWNSDMRSEADLRMRVADRFDLAPADFSNRTVLDAGAGAGDQSRYLLDQGAAVVSIDLSSAIDVVAQKLRLRGNWVGVQGDLTALPLADDQFDIVYCEGVIQHTRDSGRTVRELARVVTPGGRLLATHYVKLPVQSRAHRFRRLVSSAYYSFLRRRLGSLDRFDLLLTTGVLARLSYLPGFGRLLRATGTAMYYDLMPDFKTTWTNTYDYYGSHAFQRFITPEEFINYFASVGNMRVTDKGPGIVLAEKTIPLAAC